MVISKQIMNLLSSMGDILKKIFSLLRRRSRNKLDVYIKNGNIIVGKNANLKRLDVFIENPVSGVPYLTVGKDCMLSGQILLFGEQSRVKIGDRVFIGDGSKLFCREKIILGDDIMISWGCTLIDTNAHSLRFSERKNDVTDWMKGAEYKNWDHVKSMPIHVESKCWIGFNAIITKGVTLSEGTVLGAGSVLSKSTDSFGVYAGNPAQFIKKTD
jgi:acetyltransferase-like isoleucine patch superfamily enzyme